MGRMLLRLARSMWTRLGETLGEAIGLGAGAYRPCPVTVRSRIAGASRRRRRG